MINEDVIAKNATLIALPTAIQAEIYGEIFYDGQEQEICNETRIRRLYSDIPNPINVNGNNHNIVIGEVELEPCEVWYMHFGGFEEYPYLSKCR